MPEQIRKQGVTETSHSDRRKGHHDEAEVCARGGHANCRRLQHTLRFEDVVAQTLTTHRIPAALALEAVGTAVATCANQGYAETAVVVDANGVRQAVLRGDWAGAHTLDSAADKAYTSASFKTDTAALVERAKTAPIAPLLAKLPNLLLFGGGVVIKINNEVIGAIGAAGAPGGDLDENCARAGLEKIRDRLK